MHTNMDYEAFKDYEKTERESQTEKEWEDMENRAEDPTVDDMLNSEEWSRWIESTSPKIGHSLAWYMGMKGVIN